MASVAKATKEAINLATRGIRTTSSKVGGALGFNTRASQAAARAALQAKGATARQADQLVKGVRQAERAGLSQMVNDATSSRVRAAARNEIRRRNVRNAVVATGAVGGTAAVSGGTAGAIAANRSRKKDRAARIASETR